MIRLPDRNAIETRTTRMSNYLSRRKFLSTTAAAAAAGSVVKGFPSILHAQNKGDKLRVAFVGVGGIAGRHTGDVERMGDICTAYTDVDSNHFDNAFHFDDMHTIVNNEYIRDIRNVPRFFSDVETGSSLPTNQSYHQPVSIINKQIYIEPARLFLHASSHATLQHYC